MLFNEEFLVGASHQLVPTTSLPFVTRGTKTHDLVGPGPDDALYLRESSPELYAAKPEPWVQFTD